MACAESNVCLALGTFSDEINNYFDHFTNFKYAKGNIKKIGETSANGFVNQIEYEKDGYKSYAILKSSNIQRRPWLCRKGQAL